MAKFPDPPGIEVLQSLVPTVKTLPANTMVARIFFASGDYKVSWDEFRHYGPTNSRFDHHLPDVSNRGLIQDRGIMYLATGSRSIPTCLAEVFQLGRIIDTNRNTPILVGFELAQTIQLLDLTGAFATAMGASMAIHSGSKPRARRWSQQLYQAYPEMDGILYSSSMYANQPSIALFERGKRALPARPIFHRSLNSVELANILVETAAEINYQVLAL